MNSTMMTSTTTTSMPGGGGSTTTANTSNSGGTNQFVMEDKMIMTTTTTSSSVMNQSCSYENKMIRMRNDNFSCSYGSGTVGRSSFFAPYTRPSLFRYSSLLEPLPWNIPGCSTEDATSTSRASTSSTVPLSLRSSTNRGHRVSSISEALEVAESLLEFEPRSLDPTPIKTTTSRSRDGNGGGGGGISIVQEIKLGTNWNPDPSTTEFLKLFLKHEKKPIEEEDEEEDLLQEIPISTTFSTSTTSTGDDMITAVDSNNDEDHDDEDDDDDEDEASSSATTKSKSSFKSKSSSRRTVAYKEEQWQERYEELVEFRKTNLHCLVPHNWIGNRPLAQWVKRQRYQYKLKQENRHTTLTEERMKALDDIGFIWSSHRSSWEERFLELIEFEKYHGHCNVPSTYPENHQLSVWVKCQRRQMRLLCLGNRTSTMTKERITRLTTLGFVFNPRKLKV